MKGIKFVLFSALVVFTLSGCDFFYNKTPDEIISGNEGNENNSGENTQNQEGDDGPEVDLSGVLEEINGCFADSDGIVFSGIRAVEADGGISMEIDSDAKVEIGGFSDGIGYIDIRRYFDAKNSLIESIKNLEKKYPNILTSEIVAQLEASVHFDYESNIAGSTFYIRMSDVSQIAIAFNAKYTKFKFSSEYGNSYPLGTEKSTGFGEDDHAWEEIIPGIKMLYLFDGEETCSNDWWEYLHIYNHVFFAIVSDYEISRLAVDFEGTANPLYSSLEYTYPDISWWRYRGEGFESYYRLLEGGVLAENPDTHFSLLNTENSSLEGIMFFSDFPYKSLVDVMVNSDELPDLNLFNYNFKLVNRSKPYSEWNCYGYNLEKLIPHYLSIKGELWKYKDGSYWQTTGIIAYCYDAKDALTETSSKRMFDDSGNLHSDISTNSSLMEKISINPEFASYLIKNGVSLKNVIIKEGTWTHITKSPGLGTIANSVVNADMSGEDKANVKGIVRFNGKSPKNLAGTDPTKTIHTQNDDADNLETSGVAIDVSRLSSEAQDKIYNNMFSDVYYEGTADQIKNYSNDSHHICVYFETTGASGKKSYKGLNYDYTNEALEKYGNTGEEPKKPDDINERDDKTGLQARANNIKLTPVQKLLLDDQHIYG